MRILFTGGSSFTGYWFVKELAAAGHEVVMTFRSDRESYTGLRRQRVEMLAEHGRAAFGVSFGEQSFFDLIDSETDWHLLCHHAADVTDYQSDGFDVAGAVQNNTRGLAMSLKMIADKGCERMLVTGSVFEPGEGAGSEGLPAFSPYGLSKALTAQICAYYAHGHKMVMGKFVIPNPFGPLEEPRFTHYLIKTWYSNQTAQVRTPAYIRDNISVTLLAKAYAQFAAHVCAAREDQQINPSGYVESQGAFAMRFADNMQKRLDIPCSVELSKQCVFDEPRIRINTDMPDAAALRWDEEQAWDQIAAYYQEMFAIGTAR
jgi:UDP-glucose 4-epimerase